MSTSGDVSREQQEARVIDRRRRLEEERKARIFNAKQRTIGIDKYASPVAPHGAHDCPAHLMRDSTPPALQPCLEAEAKTCPVNENTAHGKPSPSLLHVMEAQSCRRADEPRQQSRKAETFPCALALLTSDSGVPQGSAGEADCREAGGYRTGAAEGCCLRRQDACHGAAGSADGARRPEGKSQTESLNKG